MAAVGANGNLYPCHQMSGYYEQHNIHLGNVKEEGLQKFLQGSEYLKNVCTTVKDLKEQNEKCASCQWFGYCCGGCRAVGLALTGDVLTMPGLPKVPSAEKIDVDDNGRISGLF